MNKDKLKSLFQRSIKETSEDLFYLSTLVLSTPLTTSKVTDLHHINELIENIEFERVYHFQSVICGINENKLKLILSNIDKAIRTKLNNPCFDTLKDYGNLSYSYSKNTFTINEPTDEDLFKKAFLKNIIENLNKLQKSIIDITNPQTATLTPQQIAPPTKHLIDNKYLRNVNLFVSHFVTGTITVNRKFTKTETFEIEALHKWLDFKNNDSITNKYHTYNTRFIKFLEIIDIEIFKKITENLYQSYYKEYPYSTKSDFIKHFFDYTIFDLKRFLKLDLEFLGKAPNENNYLFYTAYDHRKKDFLDFAINSKLDTEHYKQYYRAILKYLETFENNNTPQQTEKPKPEPKETELSERIKKHFGFFNRNCPRKHKQILNDTDFKKLIKWTIWYFENEFKVPKISEPIKVVNTNKTFVQLAFKYLFKELHKSSPYPKTLFEFYQSAFAPYSEDKKSNFEAVQNKDEVKKLMQIDY